jgi:MAP/microtubule affinity-regulating kinase
MSLYEVIDTRKNVNLVMELCNGKSLYHHIKKKPNVKLPESECRGIFMQVVDAVAYLHSQNIIHRDLKLDNILIDGRDNIKLIDFGFSICATPDLKLSLYCGTPHYMDPDISKKKEYNGHAADVWALGVILFILVTGKLPFFGEFEGDLFRKIQKAKYDFPKDLSSECK